MKKFLFFTFLTIVLLAATVGIFAHFLLDNKYVVFVESFGGGVLTVDSLNTDGEDDKFRVICKFGETLTVNVHPERSGKVYYNLDRLTVNGEDVTNEITMLQYKTRVMKKMTITATFKKGTPPENAGVSATSTGIKAPSIDVTSNTPYLGSLGAYNMQDPSVIYDKKSGYYYAFASDNMVVRSKDLINWTGKTNYFNTVTTDDATMVLDFSQFKSVKRWAKIHGYDQDLRYASATNNRSVLAPDIIYVDGTYYLYFSLCKEENRNESAIFCVSTTDLEAAISEKEWTDCGMVLSTCSADASSDADAVHPGVFLGAGGSLYLTYGCTFGKNPSRGAVYLLELDPATGLQKESSEINRSGEALKDEHGKTSFFSGVLLAKPGSVPELDKNAGSLLGGADVCFNEDTGYYYLLTTYGTADRNQSIRVSRAKTPEGPYLDPEEQSMAKFDDSVFKNQYTKGLPLISGYNFDKSNSGGVSYTNVGKASPGSGSLLQTKDGSWMLISHSQIFFKVDGVLTTGEKAAKAADLSFDVKQTMEVRQIVWSQTGWPLAMPEMYAGERAQRNVQQKHMAGNWDVITFERKEAFDPEQASCHHSQTVSVIDSVAITKHNIDRGTKLEKLKFSVGENGTFKMLLDGETYTVYPTLCWDWELSMGALTFTGIAENGNTVWGKKNFSATMGLYTDTFDYLLTQADDETAALYQRRMKLIESDPSQTEIDRLAIRLARELLAK